MVSEEKGSALDVGKSKLKAGSMNSHMNSALPLSKANYAFDSPWGE